MRMTLSKRRMLAAAAGAALALGLTACSSDDGGTDDTNGVASNESAEEPAEDEEDGVDADSVDEDTVEEVADTPGDDGDNPEWGAAVTTPGDKIATLEGANFQVEVYQVGVASSPKDGLLVDPDDNEPILAEGDDIVFVNYVVTNTSDETILMSSNLVSMSAEYADWPYMQGMDSITDNELYAGMDVNTSGVANRTDDGVYPLGPGQSISYGENFMYRTDVAVIFEAKLTPVDESGDLVSDDRQEVSAEVTLS